jgi:hypothetical protein
VLRWRFVAVSVGCAFVPEAINLSALPSLLAGCLVLALDGVLAERVPVLARFAAALQR